MILHLVTICAEGHEMSSRAEVSKCGNYVCPKMTFEERPEVINKIFMLIK